ncbi:MAG: DNA repair protein RecO [Clostridia bacterium]|nr:DNA repair protein RecO [Clostridia bacterium]
MYTRAKGLVIRSVPYKEADLVLTALTDEFGKITVSARGARRKNSKVSAAAQIFAFSDMVLFERQGRYTLSEAQVIDGFSGLTLDLKRMALASYFAEVLCESATEGEDAGSDLLRLALNCLYALASGKYACAAVKTAFELKFASLSGYAPELSYCALCGKELSDCRADSETGEAYCPSCAGAGIYFTENARACVRHIAGCELKKLLSFSCSAEEGAALSAFSEKYLLSRLERGFKTLDFYAKTGD